MPMADLETNKRTVVEFYELAFNGKEPEQAVEKYVGAEYIQHNPQAPDGPEAFIGSFGHSRRRASTSGACSRTATP